MYYDEHLCTWIFALISQFLSILDSKSSWQGLVGIYIYAGLGIHMYFILKIALFMYIASG